MKQFIGKGVLDEFHLREICQLSAADNFSPWLTTSQVWEELAQKAVHDPLATLAIIMAISQIFDSISTLTSLPGRDTIIILWCE